MKLVHIKFERSANILSKFIKIKTKENQDLKIQNNK